MKTKAEDIIEDILENMYPYIDQCNDKKECEEEMDNLEEKLNKLIDEVRKEIK